MSLSRESVVSKLVRPVHPIAIEGESDSVDMRSPSFMEWHELVRRHRELNGAEPTAELVADTAAVVLANPDGSRMFPEAEAESVRLLPPEFVMRVYVAAWQTVLRGMYADEAEKKS